MPDSGGSPSSPQPDRAELVAAFPRRTAHALHALLVATAEIGAPATASEILIYDEEAFSARQTGAALREARRRDGRLCQFTGEYWVAGNVAQELRAALEDRYLRETLRES